jgi:hypothetical protein
MCILPGGCGKLESLYGCLPCVIAVGTDVRLGLPRCGFVRVVSTLVWFRYAKFGFAVCGVTLKRAVRAQRVHYEQCTKPGHLSLSISYEYPPKVPRRLFVTAATCDTRRGLR